MTLTQEQSAQLKDFFPVNSHEFLQGATYLSEEAITDRLDEVDPSWEFHRLGDFAYRDNFVIATFRMTVSGVSRDGIGMWDLKMKKKDGNVIDAVDPEKSVSTDALKRAARLFGIGRYILTLPKSVVDHRSLGQWIAAQRGLNQSTGEISIVSQNGIQSHQDAQMPIAAGQNVTLPPTQQTAADTAKSRLAGNGAPAKGEQKRMSEKNPPALSYTTKIGEVYSAVLPLYENKSPYMRNSIAKMETDGVLTPDMSVDLAIRVITNHKDPAEAPF